MASPILFAASALSPSPSSSSSLTKEKHRDAIYVAAVPLRAAKGPAQMVATAAHSLDLWDLQHFMVVVKPGTSQSQAFVFDFQPQNPEDLSVAIAAISQRPVPGVVLKRTIGRLPKSRCWFVGFSGFDSVDAANRFNEGWPTDLTVGKHDCRDYTNELVERLTGEQLVLEHLRAISGL